MRSLVLAFLIVAVSFACADTCGPPSSSAIVSENGGIAVRIDFGRSRDADAKLTECIATVTRWSEEERSYRFVRQLALRNPVGPETAVVTNDGRFFVTFDDVCEVGRTENAVVIYDLERGTAFAHRIEDFLPESYRETLSNSISNTMWRDDPRVEEWNHTIYVPPPRTCDSRARVVIDPANNSIRFDPGAK